MKKDILFWMTDIKDEYLLGPDIEIITQETRGKTWKKVCFMGGMAALAAAGLLITVIRIGEHEGPLKTPVTLERENTEEILSTAEKATKMATTEIATTEIATTEEVDIEDMIPGVELDERLVIRTGEENFVVVDAAGTVTQTFEYAQPYSENGYGDNANIPMVQAVKTGKPLPVAVRQDEGEYLIGLYSLMKDEWIEKPSFQSWIVLSENLCTNSDFEKGYEGVLRNPDGSVFDENAGLYGRVGNYIYKAGGEYTHGTLLDLNGNWRSEVNGKIEGRAGDSLIIEEVQGYLITGEYTHVKEMSGMKPVSTCEEFVNWTDQNGAGVVTDTSLNVLVNDRILTERNPQMSEAFYGISVVSVNQEKGLYLLETAERISDIQTYYLCDAEFHVLEIFREEMQIIVNQITEPLLSSQIPHYEGEPWMMYEEADSFWMRSVWEDVVYELPENVYCSSFHGISRIGDIICIEYAGMGTFWQAYCITDGGNWQIGDTNRQMLGMEDAANGGFEIRTPDETGGVLEISCKNPDSGIWERHYFLEDGTYLNPDRQGELLYAAAEFYCVKDGNRIYVEDYSGNQYAELECEE